ncbi:MAG: efflux RND transporter permease subunit [Bdellovibrionota bacterium]
MKWILNRPVTLTMAIALIILLGVLSFIKVKRQINPDGFEPRYLYVSVYNIQLSPDEADKAIAEPLSGLFRTIKNIERVNSRSHDNRVSFDLEFLPTANMRTTYLEIQTVLDRSREFIPKNSKFFIWRWNPNASPILWAGLQMTKDLPAEAVENIFESHIRPSIQRIEGVASVDVYGLRPKKISISLKEELIRQYKITALDVINELQNHSISSSLGKSGDIPVIFLNQISNIEEITSIQIKPGVSIGNLGLVTWEDNPRDQLIRIDNQDLYWISIRKQDGANILSVSKKIVDVLKKIEKENNGNYKFKIVWNEGDAVETALESIFRTALFSGLIAFIVVFIFLRNLKLTILVSIAIPLAILITLIWLYFSGQSLNILSMMGIMLACGMVVDNGIVVAESIFNNIHQGMNKQKAIIAGIKDVGLAVFMGTLTSIAVFLPLILMNGDSNFSFFMSKLGMPVCIALLASLVIALVIIPYLTNSIKNVGVINQSTSTFDKVKHAYRTLLSIALKKRFEVICGLLILTAATFIIGQKANLSGGNENNTRLHFRIKFDESIPFYQRSEHLIQIEKLLDKYRSEFDLERIRVQLNRNSCCASIRLARHVDQSLDNSVVRTRLVEILPEFPGVEYNIRTIEDSNRRSPQNRYTSVRIRGPKLKTLDLLTSKVQEMLEAINGVAEVKLEENDNSNRNIEIVPNTSKLRNLSISSTSIANDVRLRLAKTEVFKLDEKYPVEVSFFNQINYLNDINKIKLQSGIPLEHLTDVHHIPKSVTPARLNGALSQQINVFYDEAITPETRDIAESLVLSYINNLALPTGYTLSQESFRDQARDGSDVLFALIMAIVLVYLIMGVLFESAVLPFIIMFTVPLAFVGSKWMSILTNTAPGIMGQLGIVILVGIVVNNGIVLIDLIKKTSDSPEQDFHLAVIQASERRLRPVLMTAATTIFSLFPMALGSSNILGIPFSPLGHAIIGGLLCSTLITLFLIPVIYTLYEDFKIFVKTRA